MKTGTKIITLSNGYHLWTHTSGHGKIHLLALHGGPGGNHEYWEDAAEQLKKQGLDVQVTMYDQLGSWYSDTPDFDDPKIANKVLTYDYFLDEVEEVRKKLGLDNFYLIGQSWGGALVQLYSLKYGKHLKGAIVSSMIDNNNDYLKNMDQLRQKYLTPDEFKFMKHCEDEGTYHNDEYQKCVDKLNHHLIDQTWPPPISHLVDTENKDIYHTFQGDNEFVVTGKLKEFNVTDQLKYDQVPTLITFGDEESMPKANGRKMAHLMQNAKFEVTPHAGHHHMIDNSNVYYKHLADFIRQNENGTFNREER